MSTVTERVLTIVSSGVELWIHCGMLRHRDLQGDLSLEDVDWLKSNESEIIEALILEPNVGLQLPVKSPSRKYHPLSFQQEHVLKSAGGGVYVVYFYPVLCGPLDVDTLSNCLRFLIERHESLRTRITVVGTTLRQEIRDTNTWELKTENLKEKRQNDWLREAQDRFVEVLEEWLDAGGPIFDAFLLRASDHESVLLLLWDHITDDYGAAATLFEELWACYADMLERKKPLAGKAAVQYGDYVIWQRDAFNKRRQELEEFWTDKLDGANAALPLLPNEESSPVHHNWTGTSVSLGESLSSALRDLARTQRISLGRVILSLFSIALSQWCGRRDLVFQTTYSGRDRSEYVDVIGLLAVQLPFRLVFTGRETFLDVLELASTELDVACENSSTGKSFARDIVNSSQSILFQWFQSHPLQDYMIRLPSEWSVRTKGLHLDNLYTFGSQSFGEQPRRSLADRYAKRRSVLEGHFSSNFGFYDSPQGVSGWAAAPGSGSAKETLQSFLNHLRLITEKAVENPHAPIFAALASRVLPSVSRQC